MRIAVCRPQVPFVRGGAEILAERLVEELRERGHEAELVTVPFKWYPDERVLTQALLWRLLDLDGGGRAAGRPGRSRRSSPRTASGTRTRSCGSCTSSGRRTSSTGPSSASSTSRRRTERCAERCIASTGSRSARRRGSSRSRRTSRTGSQRSTGLDAEVLLPPPQRARLPLRRVRGLRALGRAARPGEARRPAARGGGIRTVRARRDRRRRARPRAARASSRGGMASNGRVDVRGPRVGDELADLYARCLARLLRAGRRGLRDGPYEAFLAEKPVVTTTDAGGPLEVVHDRETGSSPSRARRALAEALLLARATTTTRGSGGRPGGALAEQVTWDRVDRAAARDEGRLLLAAAARDGRGSPTTARCCSRRCEQRSRSRSSRRGRSGAAAAPTSRSTTSATTRRRTAGSSRRCAAAGRRRPARASSCTTSIAGHDDRPRRRARLPRRDGARAGLAGRLLAHGVIDGLLPPLWERRAAGLPALRRGARPRRRA